MNREIWTAIASNVKENGYARKLGITLVEISEGYAVAEMRPGADDRNMFGTVHGAAIFSLMDEAFQASCNSHGRVAVALSLSVVYHNPASGGVTLRASSREIHLSKKTATYDIRVTDEGGVLIASCQAVAYRKKDMLPFLSQTREDP